MKYSASQNLIDIFVKNGFTDYTEALYPDHYKRSLEEGYHPHKMKRALGVSRRNCVLFDYITILPYFNMGCSGGEMRDQMTEDELKSVITFFKLPYQTRIALKREHLSIPDLHKRYYAICKDPGWYKSRGDQYIKVIFEAVNLN